MKWGKERRAARALLARNLRRLRLAGGMSQEELADVAGLRQAHISEIESGKSNVTLDSLQGLASALKVRLVELLEENRRG